MDENKINETEVTAEPETEVAVNTETESVPEAVEVNAGDKTTELPAQTKEKKTKKEKPEKIKNQALLKKGSYSVAITAIVLAAIIVVNILVGALSKRFVLDYDFSSDKKNSMSQENIDYVKKVKNDVSVAFCAAEDTYASYMGYYAQQYNITSDATDYYNQTIKIVNKYAQYNNKIDLKFIDPQSNEFSTVTSEYPTEKLSYGDIIVSATKNGNKRHKIVKFTDIYTMQNDDTYAAYGYTTSAVSGNNIENALTGAISYVLSDKTNRVAVLTGHSAADITEDYKTLLTENNYEVEVVSDKLITKISSDFDSVVIAAPVADFSADEIKALSEFLDNDSRLGKGLIFFADSAAPYLTNLYDFLEDWGISAEDGVVFETDENNHLPDDPTVIATFNPGNDEELSDLQFCISGNNVPLTASFDTREDLTVTAIMQTAESAVAAPKGSGAGFTGAGSLEKKSYATALLSQRLEYVDGTEEAKSYVCAFASSYFISSEYNNSAQVSNKDLTLKITDRLCGADKNDFSFVSKNIENVSFAESVTQSSSNVIFIIFVILLPLAMIASGIVIFIKRRNS